MLTRRQVIQRMTLAGAAGGMAGAQGTRDAETLPGSQPLTWEGDLSERMMDGAHRFIERQIAESIEARPRYWKRDLSSAASYAMSVEPNRNRFRRIIGATDPRVPVRMERFGDEVNPALAAETEAYRVHQVRWAVLEGVNGEGLLLEPKRSAAGYVVALPDADYTPEQISGLAAGLPAERQFARVLAESGFVVIVPTLIDRTSRWSGHPEIHMTDQPHREWIYRQAYHMGRHVIGYEVQKVLAAVDWIQRRVPGGAPVGVAGEGEGGLLAFYSAALDPRIQAALVAGYFDSRQTVWSEPIYRNIWGLLQEFGDAEVASLIAPRALIVAYGFYPQTSGPKGNLKTPDFERVRGEFHRIDGLVPASFQRHYLVRGEVGTLNALEPFLQSLGGTAPAGISAGVTADRRSGFDAGERQKRQVRELEAFTQRLVNESDHIRSRFFLYKVEPEFADRTWNTRLRFPAEPPDRFVEGAKWYRDYFWRELMGRFDDPVLPFNARTRKVLDRDKWTGYEVVLDVWPDVFAWGILLLPKDLRPGERRPVVVCQHGRAGVPMDTITSDVYGKFAARLADQGFIVFAPHNLYRGEDRYRWLCRKANNVKGTLFSFIIGQHQQILRWLATQPFVDGARIGFYGLSYGGETAVRVPAILENYALSICSGDFNSWTRKVAATDEDFSFMYTIEWEMPYFNLGSTFDYAEMAYLMVPRPFMVERGHHDQVGRDQWVAYEYAKVRWLYAQLGLSDRTEIQYFNGGHTINGERTFAFLHRHLGWK